MGQTRTTLAWLVLATWQRHTPRRFEMFQHSMFRRSSRGFGWLRACKSFGQRPCCHPWGRAVLLAVPMCWVLACTAPKGLVGWKWKPEIFERVCVLLFLIRQPLFNRAPFCRWKFPVLRIYGPWESWHGVCLRSLVRHCGQWTPTILLLIPWFRLGPISKLTYGGVSPVAWPGAAELPAGTLCSDVCGCKTKGIHCLSFGSWYSPWPSDPVARSKNGWCSSHWCSESSALLIHTRRM